MIEPQKLGEKHSPVRHGTPLLTVPDSQVELRYEPALGTVYIAQDTQSAFTADLGVYTLPILAASAHVTTPFTLALQAFSRRIETLTDSEQLNARSPVRLGTQLAILENRWGHVAGEFSPIIRSLTNWTLESLLAEDAFIRTFASEYAAGYEAVTPTRIETRCTALLEQNENLAPVPGYRGVLDGLTAEYSRIVASVVAELSLWVAPDLLAVDSVADLPTTAEFLRRARELADAVDRIAPVPGEVSREMLRETLTGTVALDFAPIDRNWADGSGLLSPPATADSGMDTDVRLAHLTDSSGALAWLLTRCFSRAPLAGGVFARKHHCDYLVNPWIAGPSTSGYRERWERAIISNSLVGQLTADASEQDSDSGVTAHSRPYCPLCRCRGTACGERECRYEKNLSVARSYWSSLREGATTSSRHRD